MESCMQMSPKRRKITRFFQKQMPITEQQQVMPMFLIRYRSTVVLVANLLWGNPLSVIIRLCDQVHVGSHALQFCRQNRRHSDTKVFSQVQTLTVKPDLAIGTADLVWLEVWLILLIIWPFFCHSGLQYGFFTSKYSVKPEQNYFFGVEFLETVWYNSQTLDKIQPQLPHAHNDRSKMSSS